MTSFFKRHENSQTQWSPTYDIQCTGCGKSLAVRVPLPQTRQDKGIPLKGRTRIIWFVIGIACWLAFTAYSQFDLAVSLITMPAIIAVMPLGQYKQTTLEGAWCKGVMWMWLLWWISTAFVALGLSILYVVAFYGLLVLGIPFLGIGIFLWVRDRQRVPEISATTPTRQ
jgi:hypothetical protein